MPYIAPPFTPSVTISGTDLIRNTDDKLQTIADEVGTYLETETQTIYDDLELQFEALEDSLMLVNPDGTYYTKSAIDALVNAKVSKVTSTDNALARFDGTTGAIQNSNVVVDDKGNVGIGVTPSAWLGSGGYMQFQGNGFIGNSVVYSVNMLTSGLNAYYDTEWKYKSTGVASMYEQSSSGGHRWYTAPSGTAGNAITWATALTIPNTGGIQLPNTAIANATTMDWYEEATATLTATGMTTAPTVSCKFTRIGNVVTAIMGYLNGTSNATSFTFTGVPTSFRPSASAYTSPIAVKDNGIYSLGLGILDASGKITLNKDFGGTLFTDTGAKGTNTCTFTYTL